jgi:hypothetical protein
MTNCASLTRARRIDRVSRFAKSGNSPSRRNPCSPYATHLMHVPPFAASQLLYRMFYTTETAHGTGTGVSCDGPRLNACCIFSSG